MHEDFYYFIMPSRGVAIYSHSVSTLRALAGASVAAAGMF